MKNDIWFGIGAATSLIGATKIYLHIGADPFLSGICGNSISGGISYLTSEHVAHCWGCPTALVGLAIMAASLLQLPAMKNNLAARST